MHFLKVSIKTIITITNEKIKICDLVQSDSFIRSTKTKIPWLTKN